MNKDLQYILNRKSRLNQKWEVPLKWGKKKQKQTKINQWIPIYPILIRYCIYCVENNKYYK